MSSLNSLIVPQTGNSIDKAFFGFLVLLLIPIGVAVAFYCNYIKCWSVSTGACGQEDRPKQASESESSEQAFVSPLEQTFGSEAE